MADDFDKLGEEFDDINAKLDEAKQSLRDQLFEYRDISNEAQKIARTLVNDLGTRRSILNIARNLDKVLKAQLEQIENSVKGLRTINQILKNKEEIVDGIRNLESESFVILAQSEKVSKNLVETTRKLNKELKKGASVNADKVDQLKAEQIALGRQKKAYASLSDIIQKQISGQAEIIGRLEEEEKLVKGINKSLGIVPSILGGIDKTLRRNGFGELADNLDIGGAINRTKLKLVEYNLEQKKAGALGDKFPGPFKTAGILTGNLVKSLGNALTKANLVSAAIVLVVDGILKADKAQAELQRNFNLSRDTAREIRRDFGQISNFSENVFVNVKGLQEAFSEINGSLGTSARVSGDILESFVELTKQAGFTKDLVQFFTKLGITQDTNAKKLILNASKEIEVYKRRNALVLNTKQLLEDINKISAGAAAVMGNQVENLAKSVASATALGTSVDKIERSSESLLNFESSIGNELEAQLMTGKDINLNRAREFALVGDLAGVAEEVKKQMGGLAEFQKLNVLQADSLAKAVGLTRDELAKTLLNQAALVKLSGVEGKTAQEKFNNLVKEVGLEKAKLMIGNESLANQMASVSNQEKLSAMGDKLLEIFVQIGDVLMPVFNLLSDILNVIVPPLTKGFGVIMDIFRGIGQEISELFPVSTEFGNIWSFIGKVIEIGIVAPLQGLAILVDILIRGLKSVGSLLSGIVKLGSGDFFGGIDKFKESYDQLSKPSKVYIPEDKLILNQKSKPQPFATGGIVDKPTVGLVGERGPEAIIPLNKLENLNNSSTSELKELNNNIKVLISLVREGKSVIMDGYKVGTVVALESVKAQ
jgi:hypothetical protein